MAKELELRAFLHLMGLAESDTGSITFFAQLVLYLTTMCLRFCHAQRYSFEHEYCSARTLVGVVSRGEAALSMLLPLRMEIQSPIFKKSTTNSRPMTRLRITSFQVCS